MKIISNEDYELLSELRTKKFKSEEIEGVREYYKEKIDEKNDEIKELYKSIENQEKDFNILLDLKDAEIKVKILNATEVLRKEIEKLTIENGSFKKENEILNKAFENLGFDVKDMKGILDKLVDGIVSKNTIQMIGGAK